MAFIVIAANVHSASEDYSLLLQINYLAHHINVAWPCSRSYHGVVMSHIQQVHTALGVCKGSYSKAIGGMKLFHEEATTDLDDL